MVGVEVLAKLSGYFPVTEPLRADIAALAREKVEMEAGEALIRAGEAYGDIHVLEKGWMVRSRHLMDGGRQIVNVALPGDFLCFNALMFERSQYDLVAKTRVLLSRLQTPGFRTMMQRHPGLAEALVWANAHEEALLAERVVSLGRRDATQRLAHVLCEIVARLDLLQPDQAGMRHGDVLSLPLIQEDFADILGISVIHVVRTFKRLSEIGAVAYRSRRLVLSDLAKLRQVAGFESEYLHFTRRRDSRAFAAM
jgi:CRP-like cAMP-binding protein